MHTYEKKQTTILLAKMHRKNSPRVCNTKMLLQLMMIFVVVCTLVVCQVLFGMDSPTADNEPPPLSVLDRTLNNWRHDPGIGRNNGGLRKGNLKDKAARETKTVVFPQKHPIKPVKGKTYKAPKKMTMHKVNIINQSKSKINRGITREMESRKGIRKRCPDVLKMTSIGTWKQSRMSREYQDYMDTFLAKARKQLNIVPEISRKDGRCGNVSLPYKIARALCDPNGNAPCCHENMCKALLVDKCRCDNCYDMRQKIYAEHATWVTSDKRCSLKNFNAEKACSVLAGSELYLIGDSYMRNLYSAFLIILRNDAIYGALKPDTKSEQRKRCKWIYAIGSKECRPHIDTHPGPLCNGTFRMQFISHSKVIYAPQLLQLVSAKLRKKGVVLLTGLGSHENYSSSKIKTYLKDALDLLAVTKVTWPKLIWATNHAPGLLKSLTHRLQDYKHVDTFNKEIADFVKPYNVPVFDTFDMSKDILSFDGSHYGLGLCLTKAKLYLTYLQDMKSRGVWL